MLDRTDVAAGHVSLVVWDLFPVILSGAAANFLFIIPLSHIMKYSRRARIVRDPFQLPECMFFFFKRFFLSARVTLNGFSVVRI